MPRIPVGEGATAGAEELAAALGALPGLRRLRIARPRGAGAVLFFPRHDSAWGEMLPVARLLRDRTDYLPVILIATAEAEPRVADCEAEGLSYLSIDAIAPQDRVLNGHGTLAGLLNLPGVRRRLRRDYARLRALLETLDPVLLGLPGDRELGPGPPLLRAARDLGVSSMIVSPTFPSIESEAWKRATARRFRARILDGAPLINHFVARRLPGQVQDTAFGPRLFTPGWLALALYREDMLSERPWHQGGGLSDYLMVQGEEQAARFRALGCRPEKIKVFGHMEHDLVHRAWSERAGLREGLLARHGLAPDTRLIVFAVPSYAEQALMPMSRHQEQLDSYGVALREVAAESGAAVLLSLHPKSRAADYREFAARHGFHLESERLFRLLPAADLFVSSGSTTIDWAILCGVPVVDIDYAELNIPLWDEEPAVFQAKTLPAFRAILEELLRTPGALREAAETQRGRSSRLARFDGRVAERFLGFLDDLGAARAARQAAGR